MGDVLDVRDLGVGDGGDVGGGGIEAALDARAKSAARAGVEQVQAALEAYVLAATDKARGGEEGQGGEEGWGEEEEGSDADRGGKGAVNGHDKCAGRARGIDPRVRGPQMRGAHVAVDVAAVCWARG